MFNLSLFNSKMENQRMIVRLPDLLGIGRLPDFGRIIDSSDDDSEDE